MFDVIRDKMAGAAVWTADLISPDYLQERLRTRIQTATVASTMDYLDKLGLLHCEVCPQRFGLSNVEIMGEKKKRKLCAKHHAALVASPDYQAKISK